MDMNKLLKRMGQQMNKPGGGPAGIFSKVFLGGMALAVAGFNSFYQVEGGYRAVKYSRINGVSDQVYGEGLHFRIPWFETPAIFDIRTRPNSTRSYTGTRDLQMVDITLRVLYRPIASELPTIWKNVGPNYSKVVLPSIINETLKSVIAQFNASQLITQRETVSKKIRAFLTERAHDFNIEIDDCSITHLTFGADYTQAIEDKQIAQQEAARAKYIVDKAMQDKKSTIIRAQGEAKSAELIGRALSNNPGYLELRRFESAQKIAEMISKSPNRVYLPSDTLLTNLLETTGAEGRLNT